MRYPDLKADRLILDRKINFKVINMRTLNYETGKIDDYSIFNYWVKLYEKKNKNKYYVFNCNPDCTLFIMNCNKVVYDLIENIYRFE